MKWLLAVIAGNLVVFLLWTGTSAPPADTPTAWVDQQVERYRIRADERRSEQIRWVHGFKQGKALAARHNRLLLLLGAHGDVFTGRI